MDTNERSDTSRCFSRFERMVISNKDARGVSTMLLLCWIASCDGNASDDEIQWIKNAFQKHHHSIQISDLVLIAKEGDLDSIQLACEIVRESLQEVEALQIFKLMISVAIADGYLRPSENYALRFLADVLSINEYAASAAYKDVTGKPFLEGPDLSRSDWWKARMDGQTGGNSQGRTSTQPINIERLKALAMLGLDDSATDKEITIAYRRLAMVHHPDRFHKLGPEAAALANASFLRIKNAYDYLNSNA